MNLESLPVTAVHGLAAGRLPRHHNDPFDRMLIAQARTEGLTLVTVDRAFSPYDVALLA
jgi:PIN domain nuclease of toxin-antitoxin system